MLKHMSVREQIYELSLVKILFFRVTVTLVIVYQKTPTFLSNQKLKNSQNRPPALPFVLRFFDPHI